MVEHFHPDGFENIPVDIEIRSAKDPVVPYIKERFRQDSEHLLQALEKDKQYKIDPLTGVGSIHAFYDEVQPLIDRANNPFNRNPRERLALAIVDINDLKLTNDTHGHATGDELLKVVASSLQRQSRPFDRVYRIGGDEFAVAMPGFIIPSQQMEETMLLEKVAQLQDGISVDSAIADFPPGLLVSASIGIAVLGEGEDMASLQARADKLMYDQKHIHRYGASEAAE